MKKIFQYIIALLLMLSGNVYSQTNNISIREINYNMQVISKTVYPSTSDYIAITVDNNGARWFYSTSNGLKGDQLIGLLKDSSLKIASAIFDMVYKNYNYNKEYPLSKMEFIRALQKKNIKGFKTQTELKIFYMKWDDLIYNGYILID